MGRCRVQSTSRFKAGKDIPIRHERFINRKLISVQKLYFALLLGVVRSALMPALRSGEAEATGCGATPDRDEIMNGKCFKFLVPMLVGVAGCATVARVAQLDPIGPNPTLIAQNSGPGFLQVFSARERVPIDVNGEEYFYNEDYGKNNFLHYAAHTGYALYTPDGRLVRQVRNNGGDMHNANPTTVELAPGIYEVKAAAEDYDDVALTVSVPVVIESGLTTRVHLDGDWNPAASEKKASALVCLPNGRFVGWRSPKPDQLTPLSKVNI